MKAEYILLICAGGVFLALFLIYLIYALETSKAEKRNRVKLEKSYSDGNLKKMEYDVAFYDKNAIKINYTRPVERQVTIDDVLDATTEDKAKQTENALFAHVEDEGVQEIKGKFSR